jgi:hypothetical protein
MNFNGAVALSAKRPRWWRPQADMALNCRVIGPDKPPLIKTVLDAIQLLESGQTFSFNLDYQPALLYRILDQKGFAHWTEPLQDGKWRIDVCLSPARVL